MKTKSHASFSLLVLAALFCLTVTFGLLSFTMHTSPAPTDEQAIRDIVDKLNKTQGQIPYTDDRIFWSGAFPRPIIGKVESAENKKISEKMKKERLNYKSNTNIERLVVAKSGDIAYEYGTGTLSWDTQENKHVQFDNAYLRTWKKVDAQWKVDAFFARPLDRDMAAASK